MCVFKPFTSLTVYQISRFSDVNHVNGTSFTVCRFSIRISKYSLHPSFWHRRYRSGNLTLQGFPWLEIITHGLKLCKTWNILFILFPSRYGITLSVPFTGNNSYPPFSRTVYIWIKLAYWYTCSDFEMKPKIVIIRICIKFPRSDTSWFVGAVRCCLCVTSS